MIRIYVLPLCMYVIMLLIQRRVKAFSIFTSIGDCMATYCARHENVQICAGDFSVSLSSPPSILQIYVSACQRLTNNVDVWSIAKIRTRIIIWGRGSTYIISYAENV
jgi:hypothetical protein